MKHNKANSKFNPFDEDFPKERKIKKTKRRTEHKTKSFDEVKRDLFKKLPN